MKSRLRSWKILLPLAVIVFVTFAVTASSFAAGSAKVVKVAIMTDCQGAFAGGYELDIGGAQSAFAQYAHGKPVDPKKPSAGMTGMNATLQSNIDNVRTLVNDVSSDLSAMDIAMKGMNRSISQDMADMEARLAMDIEALGAALEAVNASLRMELAALDGELADFRGDLTAGLNALKAAMDGANRTQTENREKLENLLNTINSTSLADLKAGLAGLDAETSQMGLNLNGRIDEFRTTAIGRLENISKVMATVDDIGSLTTDVKGVQGQVKEVKTEQETTSKNVAALAAPSWLAVVLIIVVLLLAAVILMKGGKKADAPVPGAPPAVPPPPSTKPLEPLLPPED